ncbi:MAG: OsmC family protein [Gammaproteobacteria bacterium]|nr:OsmC family protein [Gammaproteobacteria bacterium]
MSMLFKATVKLTEDMVVKCSSHGHSFVLDEVKPIDLETEGMNPIEATLSALGGCQLIVAKLQAKSRNINLISIRIELEATLEEGACEDPGKIPHIDEIRTRFFIKAANPEHEITNFVSYVEDNCSIGYLMKNSAQMVPEVIIED